jgi:ATP-binding cassette, subfamily G (WHITE), member 2
MHLLVLLTEPALRRYYPGLLYMASKCLLDSVLMRAVPAFLFTTPVYWMAGLQSSGERYALFVFVMIAFTIGTQFQAMLLVEWNRRAGNATVLFVLLLIIQMLFAGFLVNSDSIPGAIRWIRYCSLIYYSFEACAVNEFEVRSSRFSALQSGQILRVYICMGTNNLLSMRSAP